MSLDVMLAFFEAARRARELHGVPPPRPRIEPPPARTSRTARTEPTPRAARSAPRAPRWVIDHPSSGEPARVLVVRASSHGHVLEYVDRVGRDPLDVWRLPELLEQLAMDSTVVRVLRLEALR